MDDAACLAATHAAEGTTCATCHTDESGLASAHENATPDEAKKRATKLRSTTIDEAACLSCHGSYEELAAKTADLALLTDSEGTTVNPHAMPENEDHAPPTAPAATSCTTASRPRRARPNTATRATTPACIPATPATTSETLARAAPPSARLLRFWAQKGTGDNSLDNAKPQKANRSLATWGFACCSDVARRNRTPKLSWPRFAPITTGARTRHDDQRARLALRPGRRRFRAR